MSLYRLHLREIEGELPVAAEAHQSIVVEVADRDSDQLEGVGLAERQMIGSERPVDDLFDGVVGEHLAHGVAAGIAGEVIATISTDRVDSQAEVAGGGLHALPRG